ncbi:unnamed protein product [Spirodela intermedia]|uniref:Uncharacterized protein n=1 Tax=Spirodela intermedia TaxID=51605 RepID=A0A7I8JDZ6_SPIIN|nr:unnamed protein product [Spirodela intermedia]CAA6668231.1 unnamed protein product [Spirodela intermedia]
MAKLNPIRGGLLRKSNEGMRLFVMTIIGMVLGFLVGSSFPSVRITKVQFPSSVISYVEDKNTGVATQALLNHAWTTTKSLERTSQIYVPTNPRGAELLPPGIVAAESDLYLRRLWGNPSEDLPFKQKYLVTFTVGYAQKENINAAVKKFSGNFTILLFHYDGITTEWDDFEWSRQAIHISVSNTDQGVPLTPIFSFLFFLSRWYAKRFLHPDIVAPYEYIFIWDEDLGVEHFNAEEYIRLVKKHGLDISQPGLDPDRGLTWQMTKRRGDREVHKGPRAWCSDPHLQGQPTSGRAPWEGVRERCRNEWGCSIRLQEAENATSSQRGSNPPTQPTNRHSRDACITPLNYLFS